MIEQQSAHATFAIIGEAVRMRIAVVTEPGQVGLQEIPQPKPEADEVLIQLSACGICTFDRRMFSGEQPIYPAATGHEIAGRVIELGAELAKLPEGPRVGDHVAVDLRERCGACVACQRGHSALCRALEVADWSGDGELIMILGGMADAVLAKGSATYVVGDASATQAGQCEPLACVVHSVRRSGFTAGDRVAIIGGGYMGRLHMALLRHLGASTVGIIDVSTNRLEEASAAGASWTAVPDEVGGVGGESELVFITVGVPGAVELAIDMIAPGGSVVLYGAFPKDLTTTLNPQDFHHSEYSIVGVYAQEPSDWRRAAGIIASGALAADLDSLVTASFPLEDVADAFQMTASQPVYRVFVGDG